MKLLLLLATTGCKAPEGDSGGDCGRVPALSYDNFGEGFLGLHCTGCHSSLIPEARREGATPGVDFDSYAAVLQWSERIGARALGDEATMPPGGGPSAEERALLGEWLQCGVARDLEALEDP